MHEDCVATNALSKIWARLLKEEQEDTITTSPRKAVSNDQSKETIELAGGSQPNGAANASSVAATTGKAPPGKKKKTSRSKKSDPAGPDWVGKLEATIEVAKPTANVANGGGSSQKLEEMDGEDEPSGKFKEDAAPPEITGKLLMTDCRGRQPRRWTEDLVCPACGEVLA